MKTRRFAWVVPVICLLTVIAAVEASATTFPYKAYVVIHQARVRGGPGQAYPTTGYLAFGSEVDVYRHDPGGWCAIRPPEGSYSWVLADAAQLLPNGLAKVLRPGVPSYVGGVEVPDRSLSHVTLQEGELLEVLDARRVGDESSNGVPAAQTWLKIRPPSGEFRWIHVSSLRAVGSGEPLPPAESVSASLPLHSPKPQATAEPDSMAAAVRDTGGETEFTNRPLEPKPQRIPTVPIPQDPGLNVQADGTADTAPSGLTFATTNAAVGSRPIAAAYDSPPENLAGESASGVLATSGIVPVEGASGWRPMTGPGESMGSLRERPTAEFGPEYGGRSSGLRFSQPVVPSRNLAPLTAEEFARQAQALELELAARLTERPEAWNLSDLQQRAVDLRAAAPDGEARDRAAKIAEKIAEAEWVAVQSRGVMQGAVRGQASAAAGPSSQMRAASDGQVPASPATPLPPLPVAERPTRIAPPPTAIAWPAVPSPASAAAAKRPDGFDSEGVVRASAALGAAVGESSTNRTAEVNAASAADVSRPVPTREEIARELLELRRRRFDAVGRLIRAQVRRPGDPPYALTDEDGRVLAYLNPAPGTVVRSYVGRTVGVMGKFSGSGERRLITAEHVAVLDSQRPTPAPAPAGEEPPVRFAETPARSIVR